MVFPCLSIAAGLLLAPLFLGIINRTKAAVGGRQGVPLLQSYHDLAKLMRKGVVYSRTTTWIFRAMPAVGLAAALGALACLPISGGGSLLTFSGDAIFFAYCLGLQRFFTVAAALDTGSSFEGMGASREVQFSALAEPALILALASLARLTGSLSLSGMFGNLVGAHWLAAGPVVGLVCVALFIVLLAENSRIPVDDPNTHLELTMIHEVMILDYSGPDLAFVLYAAALKLWLFAALVVNGMLSILHLSGLPAVTAFAAGMALLAVGVGLVESVMARLSLLKVPHLLLGAGALSILAFTLVIRMAP